MITETIFHYVYGRPFVYQFIATMTTYMSIKILLFFEKRNKRYKIFKLYNIPGPKPNLFDGNLHSYIDDKSIDGFDLECKKTYGKYYGHFLGDFPSIVITDLELLRRVFFVETKSFKERSMIVINGVFADGILFAKHERWKTMRRIMSPEFNGYKMRGGSSTQFIEDSVRLMIEYLDNKLSETQAGQPQVDIHDLMKSTALHMISAMAIKLPNVQVKEGEKNVASLDSFLAQSDKGLILWAIRFPFLMTILEFLVTRFQYNSTLALIMRGLRATIENGLKQVEFRKSRKNSDSQLIQSDSRNGPDVHGSSSERLLIDTLIQLRSQGKMSDKEVIDNAISILIAGYDTTSTTLAYVFWALAKHGEVQERLRNELTAHGIESKYLEQVLNETMRLYPTVTIFTTRLATETVTIEELTIPQGSRVVYNAALMHRDPSLWPDPLKFDPERFREGVEHHTCAFAPFGLGERKCLGYQLAKLELKMITCDLLLRYRMKLKAPFDLELVKYATVLTKPKEKILLEFERL